MRKGGRKGEGGRKKVRAGGRVTKTRGREAADRIVALMVCLSLSSLSSLRSLPIPHPPSLLPDHPSRPPSSLSPPTPAPTHLYPHRSLVRYVSRPVFARRTWSLPYSISTSSNTIVVSTFSASHQSPCRSTSTLRYVHCRYVSPALPGTL